MGSADPGELPDLAGRVVQDLETIVADPEDTGTTVVVVAATIVLLLLTLAGPAPGVVFSR